MFYLGCKRETMSCYGIQQQYEDHTTVRERETCKERCKNTKGKELAIEKGNRIERN